MEVKFTFAVSKTIAIILCAAGVVAVYGIAFIITVPAAVRFAAAIAVIVLFVFAVRRHVFLRGTDAVRKVAFLPGGDMEITTNKGIWHGQLQAATINPLLTVFVVRGGNKTFNILAAFDSMPSDHHRQLRVRLQNARKPPTQQTARFFARQTKKTPAQSDKRL